MRHDYHYVEELSRAHRPVGKVIEIDRIEPNPEQPRTEIGDLTDLSASIKEQGVLEPLLVKPTSSGKWMIIAGERRWRAANLAGLTEVPCIELDIDDKTVAEIALIENLQRKDLTIWEEADGLAALRDKFGYTHDMIAKRISKSRSTVTELMSVAGLPNAIRAKCRDAKISSKSTLLEIARQFDEKAMFNFLEKIGTDDVSRDTVRKTAKADKGAEPKDVREKNTEHIFHYAPENKEFNLRVQFKDRSLNSKEGVLKALKDAFDAVKNDSIEM
jgi:ParB family chromosome partitioning protein